MTRRLALIGVAMVAVCSSLIAGLPAGAKQAPAHQTIKSIAGSEAQAKARDLKQTRLKATAPSALADAQASLAQANNTVTVAADLLSGLQVLGNAGNIWGATIVLDVAQASAKAAQQVVTDLTPVPPPPPPTTTTTTTTPPNVQHAPPAVSGLKAVVSGASVNLTWTNNGTPPSQADGNDIYRNGTKIAWPLGTSSYTDTSPGTGTVAYGVTAYNGVGEGPLVTTSVTIGTTPTTAPPSGGLIHPKGVYNGSVQSATSLSSALGLNPIQAYSYYCDGSSWSSISGCSPAGGLPSGTPLLVGLNLTPDGSTGDSQSAANLGTFQSVANHFKGYNGTVVFRLGWEMDGNWFSWGNGVNGNTPASFAAATGAIIPAMKAIMPNAQFDFSDNMGSASLATLKQFIGNNAGLWTYVGGDHYDTQGSTSGGSMSNMTAAVTLASQLGKPFSIGEWGLNGSDDTTFIAKMCQVITNPSAASAANNWPSYTTGPTSYFSAAQQIDSVITNKPNSLAAFKQDCG